MSLWKFMMNTFIFEKSCLEHRINSIRTSRVLIQIGRKWKPSCLDTGHFRRHFGACSMWAKLCKARQRFWDSRWKVPGPRALFSSQKDKFIHLASLWKRHCRIFYCEVQKTLEIIFVASFFMIIISVYKTQ